MADGQDNQQERTRCSSSSSKYQRHAHRSMLASMPLNHPAHRAIRLRTKSCKHANGYVTRVHTYDSSATDVKATNMTCAKRTHQQLAGIRDTQPHGFQRTHRSRLLLLRLLLLLRRRSRQRQALPLLRQAPLLLLQLMPCCCLLALLLQLVERQHQARCQVVGGLHYRLDDGALALYGGRARAAAKSSH
jgi:hypothetical protein